MKTTLLLVCAMLTLCAEAQQSGSVLAGCLSGETGNFILGAVPSGNVYRLLGDNALMNAHRHQLVRITGSLSGASGSVLGVQKLEVLADSCTAELPPKDPNAARPVTGKTGTEGTAVNLSDTRTAGEVTPGVQTEAGIAQQPGGHTEIPPGAKNQPPDRGKLAPAQWDQVGQDQQTADVNAVAAQRAEQRPNKTLGVDAVPSDANPQQPQGTAGTREKAKQP